MRSYRDKTANEAIKNADADLRAKKVVSAILRFVKKYGFDYDSDIILIHDGTGRRYIRKVVKKTVKPEKKKGKLSFADFVKNYEERK